jgi:PepSY-associated TM region
MFPWKRLDYLAHRWTGLVLGVLVCVWFASGIVMVFYPWPALTESRQLALLQPFSLGQPLVGFSRAAVTATEYLARDDTGRLDERSAPVVGRLMRWGDRLVYQFSSEQSGGYVPDLLVDAMNGTVLSPVPPEMAAIVARRIVGPSPRVLAIDQLLVGDRYMMNHDYAGGFPAYRVEFKDPDRTAVYVSVRGGEPFGVVTTRTRLTTWFGTVPHWFYFKWLYQRSEAWLAVAVATTSMGTFLALTGIVLGVYQLRPRKNREAWSPSPHRGVSKWHHLAGIFFGLIVLTWTFSAILENVGESNSPRSGQGALARGGALRWEAIRLTEAEALSRLRRASRNASVPIAIDLLQVRGRPGYDFHLTDGREFWVDAAAGDVRSELAMSDARAVAASILGDSIPIESADRVAAYDTYYYARPGREMHLPVWRVRFADRERSTVYLDAVNATPTGFVNRAVRRSRWLRDALHSYDYPALNHRRLLWYSIVLPLLLGGLASSGSGVVLLVRRLKRLGAS